MPGIARTFSGTFVVLETVNGCSDRGGRPLTIWRAGVTENNPSSACAARAAAAGAMTNAPAASMRQRRCITTLCRSAQGVGHRDVVLTAGGDGLGRAHGLEELRVERRQRQREEVARMVAGHGDVGPTEDLAAGGVDRGGRDVLLHLD